MRRGTTSVQLMGLGVCGLQCVSGQAACQKIQACGREVACPRESMPSFLTPGDQPSSSLIPPGALQETTMISELHPFLTPSSFSAFMFLPWRSIHVFFTAFAIDTSYCLPAELQAGDLGRERACW